MILRVTTAQLQLLKGLMLSEMRSKTYQRRDKGDYDLWSMRIEKYLTHIDYALWGVIVNGDAPVVCVYRIFTKGQKSKQNRTKPRAELDRARKTEAKGTKGLKMELKRTFLDRLDNVYAFNEVETKSKSTPGSGIGKGMEKQARNPIMSKVGPPINISLSPSSPNEPHITWHKNHAGNPLCSYWTEIKIKKLKGCDLRLGSKARLRARIEDSWNQGCKDLMGSNQDKFGGNKESKKMQKTILKQQYENFTASRSKGLDKTYDRFQKLISQLEIHGEFISQEDANLKLLRSLPSDWNNIVLIMRNKSDLDTMNMDDLYNNLKVYEAEIKGQTNSSSNYQNFTFISSEKTSSTNEAVNIALEVSTASS
ncbi:hypothetical protein Tco_1541509 [Tanacetum coccineum]